MMLQATTDITQIDPFLVQIPSAALTLQLLTETKTPSSVHTELYVASLPYIEITELDSAWLWDLDQIETLLGGTSAFMKAIRTRLSSIQHYVYIMSRVK